MHRLIGKNSQTLHELRTLLTMNGQSCNDYQLNQSSPIEIQKGTYFKKNIIHCKVYIKFTCKYNKDNNTEHQGIKAMSRTFKYIFELQQKNSIIDTQIDG